MDVELLELGEDAADLQPAGAGGLDHRRDVGQVGDGVFQIASLGQDLFNGRGRFVGVDADALGVADGIDLVLQLLGLVAADFGSDGDTRDPAVQLGISPHRSTAGHRSSQGHIAVAQRINPPASSRGRHLHHIHGALIVGGELAHALAILPCLGGQIAGQVDDNIGDELLAHVIPYFFLGVRACFNWSKRRSKWRNGKCFSSAVGIYLLIANIIPMTGSAS
ncbi:hypothetical protein D3C78_1077790 [compost metagenome]